MSLGWFCDGELVMFSVQVQTFLEVRLWMLWGEMFLGRKRVISVFEILKQEI